MTTSRYELTQNGFWAHLNIGTGSPSLTRLYINPQDDTKPLSVNIDGSLDVDGTANIEGDISCNGTVSATTFSGSGSGINALGTSTTYRIGELGINTNAGSYKLNVDGTTYISGATTLNNALNVNGNTTLGNETSDTVTINGSATLNNTLNVNGNAVFEDISCGGYLYVEGQTNVDHYSDIDSDTGETTYMVFGS